jgi:hypothetical protein
VVVLVRTTFALQTGRAIKGCDGLDHRNLAGLV